MRPQDRGDVRHHAGGDLRAADLQGLRCRGQEGSGCCCAAECPGCATQLSSKRVDAVFYDTPSLAWAAKQQPQAFELFPKQYVKKEGDDIVALGLEKGSPLTPALHAAMQSLIDGPEYKATLEKWGLGSGAIPSASVAK